MDQFEELFRFRREEPVGPEREDGADFVNVMLRLAEQAETPIYVCMTMRSDFLGDCDGFYGLPEAMNRSQYLVPRLTRTQRREAITGPIRLSGGTMAARLLDRLLNESVETRDDLPVLQHALMRTWAEWAQDGEGSIDVDHYEGIHTLKEALDHHAEEALQELDDREKQIAKRLFQTITETDASNRPIRRPAHLDEITAICGATQEEVLAVIHKFREGDCNFLVLSSENPEDNPLVDISHETLIRQWRTLTDWVDEEAESAGVYRRLAETAELEKQGKAGLYREADLQVALDWQEGDQPMPSITWARRYHEGFAAAEAFLARSRDAHDDEVRAKEEQRAEREHLLLEKAELMERRAQEQRKVLRWTRVAIAVISLLLVAAAISAWIAIERSKVAKRQTLEANYNLAKVFEEKALSALDRAREEHDVGEYKLALLYAGASLQQKIAPDRRALPWESVRQLFDPAVVKSAFAEKWFSPAADFHRGWVSSVAFSPDGNAYCFRLIR